MPGPYLLQPCHRPAATATPTGISLASPVIIRAGVVLVGRQNLIDPSCKKVSRKQLVLRYAPEEDCLTVCSEGTNPSYVLFSQPGGSESFRLIPDSKSAPISLRAGDRITLHGHDGLCVVVRAGTDITSDGPTEETPLKRRISVPPSPSTPKRRAVDPSGDAGPPSPTPSPMHLMSVDTLPLTPDDDDCMRQPTRPLSACALLAPLGAQSDMPPPPVQDTLVVADASDTESIATERVASPGPMDPDGAAGADRDALREPSTPSTEMEDDPEAASPSTAPSPHLPDCATLVVEEDVCTPTLVDSAAAFPLPLSSSSKPRQATLAQCFAPRSDGPKAVDVKPRDSATVSPAAAARSLAFIPFGTSDAPLAAGANAIQDFLAACREPQLRLRLLCPEDEAHRWHAALGGVQDERLSVAVGDGTEETGSWFLAAPVSWRFKGASPLLKAAGGAVEEDAKRQYRTGVAGHAYLVDLSPTSLLSLKGARHLILAVTPNTNPSRPDCVVDPTMVRTLFYSCYTNTLSMFARACTRELPGATTCQPAAASLITTTAESTSASLAGPPPSREESLPSSLGRYQPPAAPKPMPHGAWQDALIRIVQDLSKSTDVVYFQDARCVAIYDAFPKASVHLLLLPLDLSLQGLHSLQARDLSLLHHLHAVAERITRHLQGGQFPRLTFQAGYHALPSLRLLHLHLISRDFHASDCLKNKKHWNTFTTDFFLASEQVIGMLQSTGRVVVDAEQARVRETQALVCPLCDAPAATIPAMKRHYQACYDKHRAAWTARP